MILASNFFKKNNRLTRDLCVLFILFLTIVCCDFNRVWADEESESSESRYSTYHSQYGLGLQLGYTQKVIFADDFESTASMAHSRLYFMYFGDKMSITVLAGTSTFETEETTIDPGIFAGMALTIDYYKFQVYQGLLRARFGFDYFSGEGETTSEQIPAQVDYFNLKIDLEAIVSMKYFSLYGGPVIALINGTYSPDKYGEVHFEENQVIGFLGGVSYVPGSIETWHISFEAWYFDDFHSALNITYKF